MASRSAVQVAAPYLNSITTGAAEQLSLPISIWLLTHGWIGQVALLLTFPIVVPLDVVISIAATAAKESQHPRPGQQRNRTSEGISLYGTTHGPWCNTRTYPTTCRQCKASVYFFSCTHGSRVFFDNLGGSWPIHRCNMLPAASGQADRIGGAAAAHRMHAPPSLEHAIIDGYSVVATQTQGGRWRCSACAHENSSYRVTCKACHRILIRDR